MDQEKEVALENRIVSRFVRRLTSGLIIFISVYVLSLMLAKAVLMMNLDKLQILFSGTLNKESLQGMSGLFKLAGILMNSTMFNTITADGKMLKLGFIPLMILPMLGIIIANYGFYKKRPSFKTQAFEYTTISGVYLVLSLIISGLIQMKDANFNSISVSNMIFSFILMTFLQYIIGTFFEKKSRKSQASKAFDLYTTVLMLVMALGIFALSFKIFGLKELYFGFLVLLNGIAYGMLFVAGVPLEYSILGDRGALTFFHVLFQDSFLKLIAFPWYMKVGAALLVFAYAMFLFVIIGRVLRRGKWAGVMVFTFMVSAFYFVLSYSSGLMIGNASVLTQDVSIQFGSSPLLAVLIPAVTCLILSFLQLILIKVTAEFDEDEEEYEDYEDEEEGR